MNWSQIVTADQIATNKFNHSTNVRDANGELMAIYQNDEQANDVSTIRLDEIGMYKLENL